MSQPFHKYGARKVVVDGVTFDSQGEATRYQELKLLERAGEIQRLELKPVYELQPGFSRNGRRYHRVKYTPDFRYRERGRTVVEDFKGFETETFKLKKRMFMYQNPDVEFRVTK